MMKRITISALFLFLMTLASQAFAQSSLSGGGNDFPRKITRANAHLFGATLNKEVRHLRAGEENTISFTTAHPIGHEVYFHVDVPDSSIDGLEFVREAERYPGSSTKNLQPIAFFRNARLNSYPHLSCFFL